MMFTKTLSSAMSQALSESLPAVTASATPDSLPYRLGANATSGSTRSSSGGGARLYQGLSSRCSVGIHTTEASVVQAASSFVLTISIPVFLSSLSRCSACPLCSLDRDFLWLPLLNEAFL